MRSVLFAAALVALLAGCSSPGPTGRAHPESPAAASAALPASAAASPSNVTVERWLPIEWLDGGGGASLDLCDAPKPPLSQWGHLRNGLLIPPTTFRLVANLTVGPGTAVQFGSSLDNQPPAWSPTLAEGPHLLEIPYHPGEEETNATDFRWAFGVRPVTGVADGPCPTWLAWSSVRLAVSAVARLPPETLDGEPFVEARLTGMAPQEPSCGLDEPFELHHAHAVVGARVVANLTLTGTWTGWQLGHQVDAGAVAWSETFVSGSHTLAIPVAPDQVDPSGLRWRFFWRIVDGAPEPCADGGLGLGGGFLLTLSDLP